MVVAVAAAAVAVAETAARDRVGLGWRAELAASIHVHADQIDIVEVIAENHYRATRDDLNALRSLARRTPLSLHGVSMGLATCAPVPQHRLDAMARLVHHVEPESWSEHLAFVRAGGHEIGHMAAPPRTSENIDATLTNIERARAVVGSVPHLENIATLIDPPCSTMSECAWLTQIVTRSGAGMLLDLHNLYANAMNFGRDPAQDMLNLPLDSVRSVHLSGGHWIAEPSMPAGQTGALTARQRLLDDHIHDPPQAVYELLTLLAQHCTQALDVIIERDGHYPAFDHLLEQVAQARSALMVGRRQRQLAA